MALSRLVAPRGILVLRTTHLPDSLRRGASAQEIKRVADLLWDEGRRREAVEALRAGALRPDGHRLWWPLYWKLQALGLYDAASLTLHNTLDVDPGNLGALEMLVEEAPSRGPNDLVQRALDRLPTALASRPDKHQGALFFALPADHGPTMELLRASPDVVVRQAMSMFDHLDSLPLVTPDGPNALPLAIVAMCVGQDGLAVEAIRGLPDDAIPVDGLRVTVRRLLRTNRRTAAREYLEILARLRPDDTWISTKLAGTSVGILSPSRLAQQGYPFPAKRSAPLFKPEPRTSLYLLHNSLPYHSAGYSTRTHGLLSAVKAHGWNVQGVTRLGYPFDMPGYSDLGQISPVDVVEGITYHRLTVKNQLELKSPLQGYVMRYSDALHQLALRERPFVIHAASNHWNGLAAVQTANALGLASIYEVRGLWEVTRGSRDPEWAGGGMFRFMARMEAEAASHATHVLTITHALKDELIARGVDPERITIVPNGVNGERFSPRPRNEVLARHVGVAGRTVIGYIGSVLDYEGLGLLIDAAAQLAAEGREFAVLIVGDGAELGTFQREVEERHLQDNVIFTGRIPHDEVEDYYSLVDIAPFPRLALPVCEMVSPLKPFEAMVMQKAVVASDVAALQEIVQDGRTGLLHRKGDAEDLKNKLKLLLDDPALRARLAEAGRNWVLAERQWSDVGGLVSDIYGQLSARSR